MWLDLNGFRRKMGCRPRIRGLAAIGIDIVNRHVGIGNGSLFQVLVHTPAPALVTSFELDGDARAAAYRMGMMGLLIPNRVVRCPFDPMLRNVLLALFTGRNVFAVTSAVDNF